MGKQIKKQAGVRTPRARNLYFAVDNAGRSMGPYGSLQVLEDVLTQEIQAGLIDEADIVSVPARAHRKVRAS